MEQPGGWWPRFYDRVHAARIGRWQRGELDDAGFERAQRAWARNLVLILFAIIIIAIGVIEAVTHGRPTREQLEHLLFLAGVMAAFALVFAIRVSRFAGYGARDFLMRRLRETAERHPARDLTSSPGPGVRPALTRGYGSYHRSIAQANRYLMLSGVGSLALGGVMAARPQLVWMAPVLAIVIGRALYMRLDRRPFLDISAEGIWCRSWGQQRHPFATFKAVYPRQNRMDAGVAFVPRAVADFGRTLSWTARYSLRSGDGFPAHIGSLTIWATQVGLNRDTLLREMQAQIVEAQTTP